MLNSITLYFCVSARSCMNHAIIDRKLLTILLTILNCKIAILASIFQVSEEGNQFFALYQIAVGEVFI